MDEDKFPFTWLRTRQTKSILLDYMYQTDKVPLLDSLYLTEKYRPSIRVTSYQMDEVLPT